MTVVAMAGMLAASLAAAGTASAASRSPASSAPQTSTKDYTCHPQAEGIYTCQWLRQTLATGKCPPCETAYELTAWFSMKGGAANREIVYDKLEARNINGPTHVVRNATPRTAGYGYVSAHLAKVLCTYVQYRPVFKFKYFASKPANQWVYGWSYGTWYNAPYGKYCHQNIGI